MADFKRCIDGYNDTKQECTDLRDDGYDSCTEWGQDCRSWAKKCVLNWIPFIGPAICKVFEWVCTLSEWVCTAAVWVVNMVCHAWKLIHVFVCTVWEIIGWVMTIPAIFIKLIFAIPILGAFFKEIFNFVTALGLGVVGAIVEGFVCGLIGICPAKRIRLCVIISRDGRGPVGTQAEIQPLIDRATQIFKDEANIYLTVDVHEKDGPYLEEVDCDGGAWLEDMGTTGMTYELTEGRYCVGGALSSIVGLGSPIYAICVRSIKDKNGCSLWWLTNYLTFEPPVTANCSGGTHLAHEMGHCCGLARHDDGDTSNLMYRKCQNPGRDQMSAFQKSIVRGSKYATYF